MQFPKLLVKMPDIEIAVLLSVQPQDLFGGLQRNPVAAGFAVAAICQTSIAVPLQLLPHPPHPPSLTPIISAATHQVIFLAMLSTTRPVVHYPLHFRSGIRSAEVHTSALRVTFPVGNAFENAGTARVRDGFAPEVQNHFR
jgi:hypothetical protein